jgi:hypothetical protein
VITAGFGKISKKKPIRNSAGRDYIFKHPKTGKGDLSNCFSPYYTHNPPVSPKIPGLPKELSRYFFKVFPFLFKKFLVSKYHNKRIFYWRDKLLDERRKLSY